MRIRREVLGRIVADYICRSKLYLLRRWDNISKTFWITRLLTWRATLLQPITIRQSNSLQMCECCAIKFVFDNHWNQTTTWILLKNNIIWILLWSPKWCWELWTPIRGCCTRNNIENLRRVVGRWETENVRNRGCQRHIT